MPRQVILFVLMVVLLFKIVILIHDIKPYKHHMMHNNPNDKRQPALNIKYIDNEIINPNIMDACISIFIHNVKQQNIDSLRNDYASNSQSIMRLNELDNDYYSKLKTQLYKRIDDPLKLLWFDQLTFLIGIQKFDSTSLNMKERSINSHLKYLISDKLIDIIHDGVFDQSIWFIKQIGTILKQEYGIALMVDICNEIKAFDYFNINYIKKDIESIWYDTKLDWIKKMYFDAKYEINNGVGI